MLINNIMFSMELKAFQSLNKKTDMINSRNSLKENLQFF